MRKSGTRLSAAELLARFSRANRTLPAFLLVATVCRTWAQFGQEGLGALAEGVTFLVCALVVVVWVELSTDAPASQPRPIRRPRVEAWLVPLLIAVVFHNILRAAKLWHLPALEPVYGLCHRFLEQPLAAAARYVLSDSVLRIPFIKEQVELGFGVTTILLVLALPLVALRLTGYSWHDLGFRWSHGALTVALAAFFLTINFIAGAVPNAEWLACFAVHLIFAGLREEFWYRSFLQTKMEPFFRKPSTAIVAGSILFALWHVPITLAQNEGISLLDATVRSLGGQGGNGFLFGLLYFRTRSLLPCVVLHGVMNAYALCQSNDLGFSPILLLFPGPARYWEWVVDQFYWLFH